MSEPVPLPPLRPAQVGDAEAIADLRDDLARWLIDSGVHQWQPGEVTVAEIAAGVGDGQWHVATIDHEVVACVKLSWSDPDFWGADNAPAGYIHGLMVHRDHAGSGWGRQIIDWCADRARDAGHDRLRLDTAAHNTTMVDYYRARGFDVVREADLPPMYGREMRIVLFERVIG
ncbi:GNAT family N-acetyltransferase [Williamsia sp. CHRR-6]|uniref:GNAT family N-acetyltransferase n=1 Tax=Williamsia sp. CHRR-6 TaxID=2835871 RepID=UPI001BDB0280|nr:GNAT family N-acetyltransferase [Williamsia sp. CHRR-6]MBT0565592.1 GNAT family N-acetyltransferase [Williamsia sp. CHRR-6]